MSAQRTDLYILDVAKKMFHEVGIASVTMNMLADETGYARRTLYRHYDSKEDIAYHVMLSYMELWNKAQHRMFEDLTGNGLQKLEQQLLRLLDYMESEVHIIRFMADFDNYFRDSVEYQPDQQIDEEAKRSFHLSDELFNDLIDEGISDGSIVLEEDKALLLATVTHVLWIFGQSVALRGKHIEQDSGFDGIEMFRCQIRLYMRALKG